MLDRRLQLLSVAVAAARLGVPELTVRGWLRRGIVPSLRIGGRRLIDSRDLERLVETGKVASAPPDKCFGLRRGAIPPAGR